jgi:hypothetical protein
MKPTRFTWVGVAAAVLAVLPGTAHASDRMFSYTYQTNVLNPGATELEPWTTIRAGRERHYLRFDNRLELEAGVVRNLQTALYLNTRAVNQDTADELGAVQRTESYTFRGVSSEWKYKLSDPIANVLGSALYLEGGLGPHESEVELKLLLDKHFGDLVIATNLVGEYEHEWETRGELENEVVFEVDLGLGYRVTDSFAAGLEVRQVSVVEGGELESAALFGGPSLAYLGGQWWSVLTFMPQWVAFQGASDGDFRDLQHQEKVQVRLLMGFHL